MPYTTAIFDRTQTDITNRTSKAFMNVADWVRIYDNALFVRNELQTSFGVPIGFTTIAVPTTTSFPTASDFNTLLNNIELLRLTAAIVIPNLLTAAGFYNVASDWQAGISADAPDYNDVNHWEKVVDIIHSKVAEYSVLWFRFARTGIASAGAELIRNNMFRS